ncbi:uncharacterized protein [Ptychodera flava]|uniref:uncharacterized protein n=1 Tax=Ptychodera flava TaxID=63121 RepID=UPI003969E42F
MAERKRKASEQTDIDLNGSRGDSNIAVKNAGEKTCTIVQGIDEDSKRPAALIVIEWWEICMFGGITASLYYIVHLLKSLGVDIYCMVLEADGKTEKEAKRLGVRLLLPERKRHQIYERPTSVWLTAHLVFFSRIKKIPNLKLVFGFGLITSSIALDIQKSALPNALYCLVNIWNPENISNETLECDEETFEERCKLLDEEHLVADMVISVDSNVFDYFSMRYQDPCMKHFRLSPIPCQMYFEIPILKPKFLPTKISKFRIMTVFDKSVISDLTTSDSIVNAMSLMASTFLEAGDDPPQWIIPFIGREGDNAIQSVLKPYGNLQVTLKRVSSVDDFKNELRSAHLVVVPRQAMGSFDVAVSTMASGKPIIVPRMSQCDEFIKENFPLYRDGMVVEMRMGPESLKKMIINVIKSYSVSLERASCVREILRNKIDNASFAKEINCTLHMTRSEESSAECASNGSVPILGSGGESNALSDMSTAPPAKVKRIQRYSSEKEKRSYCTVAVQVGTSFGCAVNGTTMSTVESEFYEIQENRPITEGAGEVITNVHPDLSVVDTRQGSLKYVTRCGSMEALEALWSEYISGRLDKTIHSTIITPTLLSKIQAHYLTLDIYIPVQEYLLCKREIPLLTGDILHNYYVYHS